MGREAAAVGDAVDRIDDALQRAEGTFRSVRMSDDEGADAMEGVVRWKPVKSAWIGGMTLTTLIAGPILFTWGSFALFLIATAATICLGHSLGMHRRLIHRSFDCPLWVERLLVYFGVLVGLAGPYGMIRQHDIRDWAQRKPACHAYLAHRSSVLRDGYWQLHCELILRHPPRLTVERRVAEDRFYRFLERTFMAQQIPLAVAFFLVGGLPWLVWGIAARIAFSVTGHWLVGYFAHNKGNRSWGVAGAGVQGYNVPYCGLVTMGEAYHNNHHAFPASARLSLRPGEIDLGWWVLRALRRMGLAWNLKTPETLPFRPNLFAVPSDHGASRPALRNGLPRRYGEARPQSQQTLTKGG